MIRRLALATALLTATLFAQTAPAPNPHPYTMLYVFGDSYSDSGSGYLDTNGPTAVAYLAQRLGIPFTTYGDPHYNKTQGLNFAISGAQSGEGNGRRYPTGEMLSFGMKNQVANFVAFSKTKDIPPIDATNTLFFFAGGLNDRGLRMPGCPAPARPGMAPGAPASSAPTPQTPPASAPAASTPLPPGCEPGTVTRNNIEAEIDTLYDLGARRFMVALLPTKIPQFASAGLQFNSILAQIPDEERAKHPDIRIANSNWGAFLDEVMTNPAKYGITDTKSPCAGRAIHHEDTTPCASPDTHFFYHEGHPSTAAHRAVGDMLYTEATQTP